jgi:glycosyltransferase involved in cell wall biosynthesis
MPCYQINSWLNEALTSVNRAGVKVNADLVMVANNMDSAQLAELNLLCTQLLTINFRIVDAGKTNLVTALNYGLKYCQHELIARMDQDDLMEPDRLILQRNFMELNPDHVLVGGSVIVINQDGSPIYTQKYLDNSDDIVSNLKRGNCFAHPAVMYRKSSLARVGGYSELFPYAEDFDLFVRLSRIGKLANLAQVVLRYRVSQFQVSYKHRQAQIVSTKAIIISQEVRALTLEKEFPLPDNPQQLTNWIRKLRGVSLLGFFSTNTKRRSTSLALRKAFSLSFLAIARSAGTRMRRLNSQVLRNLFLAFVFSPSTLLALVVKTFRNRALNQAH